jgi:hypothetical protein
MVAEALSMDMRARRQENHRFGACSAVQECWEWGCVTVLGGERSLIQPPMLPDQVFSGQIIFPATLW